MFSRFVVSFFPQPHVSRFHGFTLRKLGERLVYFFFFLVALAFREIASLLVHKLV